MSSKKFHPNFLVCLYTYVVGLCPITNYRHCLMKFPNAANWRQLTFRRIYLFPCQIVFSTCRRSFKSMHQKNSITDVDIEMISACESLENLNLEENPLTRD